MALLHGLCDDPGSTFALLCSFIQCIYKRPQIHKNHKGVSVHPLPVPKRRKTLKKLLRKHGNQNNNEYQRQQEPSASPEDTKFQCRGWQCILFLAHNSKPGIMGKLFILVSTIRPQKNRQFQVFTEQLCTNLNLTAVAKPLRQSVNAATSSPTN